VKLELCLGVREGAVVPPGTGAVLGQIPTHAGLEPGEVTIVRLPGLLRACEIAEADESVDDGVRRPQGLHHALPLRHL